MKYVVWNNKGGVGKSFLTFALATEYAYIHPKKKVYVIDMCPQANVSEIILGGNGPGSENIAKLIEKKNGRQTIGGYFDERLKRPHERTGNESNISVKAQEYNQNMPENLFLVAGDPSLEVQTEAINQIAAQTLPKDTWKNVHSWVKDLTQSIYETEKHNATFFIDCNPSFAAYTELAIIAADKLIVPCTADGSSARAIDNIGQLIYGNNIPSQYEKAMFAKRIKVEELSAPSIHMILLNRSTQYNQKASKAFGAMFNEIKNKVKALLKQIEAGDYSDENMFFDIPDTHSVAIVASHKGMPIRNIEVKSYDVYDQKPQVNREPLERYKKAIKNVAKRL